MKMRAAAILLSVLGFGGAGIDGSGEPAVRRAAGADLGPAAADLGHSEKDTVIAFEDITRQSGLDALLDCMMGHSAAVGDVDADGLPDLFFGTFTNRRAEAYLCDEGARPDRLLRNAGDGTWRHEPEPALEQHARSSGAVFADLDNDGDLDLVVTRNARGGGDVRDTRSNALYRNDGGRFIDVTEQSNLTVAGMKARNVIPLDYDGDGLLDLFIVEDLTGEIGSKLFHNEGDLRFRDRTGEAALPTDLGGLGAAVGDVNQDGWPDIFVAHEDKLFVNDGRGRYGHAAGLDEVFRWPGDTGSEDWRAGAAFGDADRDGLLDLVVGHHYGSADKVPQSVRLYLNRSRGGSVAFEDVTSQAGLDPIPVKAPHVEMQDMDNDGWSDIVVSVHAVQEGAATPLVFRNKGGGDVPTFATPPFSVPVDRESNLGYWPAAPTVDFDRDGRLDLFGVEWVPSRDSLLYRNVSRAGNYLQVMVRPADGTNAMGIGARIELYEAGRLGDPAALVGRSEIATGYGYSSGQEAVAHFGLADREQVDLRVVLPHGGAVIERAGVPANQRLMLAGAAP
ncbi:MAG TPA: CRTAC1 family protein [Geminicoccaceae bacterium]